MKCPNCGREINDDNQYCPYCGNRIPPREEVIIDQQIREIRFKQFSYIMNRILNIATIVAIVFCIIGIFGPAIDVPTSSGTLQVGGMSWFVYEGWVLLNDGVITVGPFYLTFVLYLIMVSSVIALSVHAMFKTINALRRREECHTIPHIIGLTLIYRIYSAFLYCFYYEYEKTANSYYEVGSGWGSTVYGVAIPLFTIGLIAFYIMKRALTDTKKEVVKVVFALISSFVLANSIEVAFAVLGFQDLHIGEQVAFGTLHYFDVCKDVPGNVVALIVTIFIFGLLFIATSATLLVTTIRNLVKYDKIDAKLFFILSTSNAGISLLLLIFELAFGFKCNDIPGFKDNVLFSNSNMLLLFFASLLALGFGIAIFAMSHTDKKPTDSNIIDVEVFDKDA